MGCAAGSISPQISAVGRPFPGSIDFSLRLVGGAPPSSAAFLLLGLLPTGMSLDAVGMPGCWLLTQPLDTFAVPTSPLGNASARLLVPPDASLAGASMFAQWLAVAPGANALALLSSDGGRIASDHARSSSSAPVLSEKRCTGQPNASSMVT